MSRSLKTPITFAVASTILASRALAFASPDQPPQTPQNSAQQPSARNPPQDSAQQPAAPNTAQQPAAPNTAQQPADPNPPQNSAQQPGAPSTPQNSAQQPATPNLPQNSAQQPATSPPQRTSDQAPNPPAKPSIPEGITQSAEQNAKPGAPKAQGELTSPTAPEDPSISLQELRARHLTSSYRPAHNPLRFQGTVRAGMYAGGTTRSTGGGRGLGLEIESGFSKNMFGLSLALGAQFGRFQLVPLAGLPHHPEVSSMARPKHPGYKSPVNLNAGLRAGIGRLALQGTGFIDPRIGYELNWSPVQRISGHRPKKVAVTHGPSLRIDAGFLAMAPGKQRDFRRVFGATLGWDMRVGGINTTVPASHFIFIGVFAQMN